MQTFCSYTKSDQKIPFEFLVDLIFSDLKISTSKLNWIYFEVTFGEISVNTKSLNYSRSTKEPTEKIEIPVKNLSKHLLNVAFNKQAFKSIMIINKIRLLTTAIFQLAN